MPLILLKLPLAVLAIFGLVSLQGCGCGFNCNSGDDGPDRVTFDLSLSDALPEDLQEVAIEINSVTLRRSNADNIVIDTFTVNDPDDPPEDTVTVDLLQYPGAQQFPLIRDLEVDSGDYSGIELEIISGDSNNSYVLEKEGQQRILEVTNNTLSLPGVRLSEEEESYTIEFELARSLDFESNNSVYRLSEEGIRVVDDTTAATLSGFVDEQLFDQGSTCSDKLDAEEGNRVYLYEGKDLSADNLADVFNANSSTEVPTDAIAPLAVGVLQFASATASWAYFFGFLPAGDYTLAFACDTEDDDPNDYDGLVIPAPEGQILEVELANRDRTTCDFRVDSDSC